MKREFKLVELENLTVVIVTSNKRLPEILIQVENSLKRKKYSGMVIFDLLISNGNSSNRFVEVEFINGSFAMNKMKSLKNVRQAITEISSNYYSNHTNLIKEAILSRTEKHKILNQLNSKNLSLTI